MKRVLAPICALICAAAFAQQPTFRTQTPLVIVPVSVTAPSGERLMTLAGADFRLLDNGKERAVTVEPWGTYQAHIALAMVIETSDISTAALLKVKKIGGMLDTILGERGDFALITTDSEVRKVLDFTSRWEPIQEAFETLKARGGMSGRVLDGVDAAIDLLAKRPPEQRRIILLLSESRDRGSESRAADVVTRAQQANVTIYSVSYSVYATTFTTKGADVGPDPWHGILLPQLIADIAHSAHEGVGSALSRYTGGKRLSFATVKKLEEDLAAVGEEVHSQYLLTFTAENEKEPVYHRLSVSVKGHADAAVVARPGYWTAGLAQ